MKNPIENLNKIFDSRIRMGVMSILIVNEEVSFNDLKKNARCNRRQPGIAHG